MVTMIQKVRFSPAVSGLARWSMSHVSCLQGEIKESNDAMASKYNSESQILPAVCCSRLIRSFADRNDAFVPSSSGYVQLHH